MAITPIDMSGMVNQRSDLSKVAGDDFLKIQQQQLASVIAKEEEDHRYETKQIDPGEDVKINTEGQRPRQQESGNETEKREKPVEEEPVEDELKNVEFAAYNDPDLGQALDWKG